MAWTAPRTWATGETITSVIMNTHIRDNLVYLDGAVGGVGPGTADWPIFRGYKSGRTSVAAATWTRIVCDVESVDTAGAFASGNFTVPSGADGMYMFSFYNYWQSPGAGRNLAQLYKNAAAGGSYASYTENTTNSSVSAEQCIVGIIPLVATDYVAPYVYSVAAGTMGGRTSDGVRANGFAIWRIE